MTQHNLLPSLNLARFSSNLLQRMKDLRMRSSGTRLAAFYLVVVLGFLYAPLALMILQSFYGEGSALALDSYRQLITDAGVRSGLVNSVILATSSSILACILGTLIALSEFLGAKPALNRLNEVSLFLMGLLPDLLLALSWLWTLNLLGLPESFWALLAAHTSLALPYCVYLIRGHLRMLDRKTFEAARDLGATGWSIFHRLILPQLMPTLLACLSLSFFLSTDDVLISTFLAPPDFQTLPCRLMSMARTGATPVMNALVASLTFGSGLVCLVAYGLYTSSIRRGFFNPFKPRVFHPPKGER